jgi:hypothetical protein
MRTVFCAGAAALVLAAAGCDSYRGPRLALPTAPGARAESTTSTTSATSTETAASAEPLPGRFVPQARSKVVYGGRTAEQWGDLLRSRDRDEVIEACRALRVLGAEGRPFLFQGLESLSAETRWICLNHLSVSDFKRQSEEGRRLLVRLAADRDDMRIRAHATSYLAQWYGAVPSP